MDTSMRLFLAFLGVIGAIGVIWKLALGKERLDNASIEGTLTKEMLEGGAKHAKKAGRGFWNFMTKERSLSGIKDWFKKEQQLEKEEHVAARSLAKNRSGEIRLVQTATEAIAQMRREGVNRENVTAAITVLKQMATKVEKEDQPQLTLLQGELSEELARNEQLPPRSGKQRQRAIVKTIEELEQEESFLNAKRDLLRQILTMLGSWQSGHKAPGDIQEEFPTLERLLAELKRFIIRQSRIDLQLDKDITRLEETTAQAEATAEVEIDTSDGMRPAA